MNSKHATRKKTALRNAEMNAKRNLALSIAGEHHLINGKNSSVARRLGELSREFHGNPYMSQPLIHSMQNNPLNRTRLMGAALSGDVGNVKKYIEEGNADLLLKDKDGNTALMLACMTEQEKGKHNAALEYLLNQSSIENNQGMELLNYASINGCNYNLKFLLSKGLTFGTDPALSEILYNTVQSNNLTIYKNNQVKEKRGLIKGIQYRAKEKQGEIDILNSYKDTINTLIDFIPLPNEEVLFNALLQSIIYDHLEIARLLLDRGANVNAATTDIGMTSLMWASHEGHLEIARLLLDRGANVNAAKTNTGMTSLMWASRGGHSEIVHLLLDRGANVNAAKTNTGMTSLMWASQDGHSEIVHLLLDRGANVNAATTDGGKTSLMWASRRGHLEAARLLLDRGANVNAARTDDGETSLMLASQKGYLKLARLLIDRGANVNAAETDGGTTSLMWASQKGYLELARLLLDKGANVNPAQPPDDDVTSLMLASHNGHLKLARLLIDRGADYKPLYNDMLANPGNYQDPKYITLLNMFIQKSANNATGGKRNKSKKSYKTGLKYKSMQFRKKTRRIRKH